jgi:hypothetical protein
MEEEFEIERIIPVNVIEDKKQMRVTIPAEIVEDFRINPERHQFTWVVEVDKKTQRVTITGRFTIKQKDAKEKD